MTATDKKHSDDHARARGMAPAPGKTRAKAANGKFIKTPASPEAGEKAADAGQPRGNSGSPKGN